jgi:Cu(I)/Ag(I) efflux system periplasmic protein CusF
MKMKCASVSGALPLFLAVAVTPVSAASPWALVPSTVDPQPLQLVHEGAAQATGKVNTVDAARRKVNMRHKSVKQLGWPAMTMDFPVGEAVDLTTIKPGMKVNFTLIKGSGGAWTIDTLKAAAKL